jgi:hypothetical protein
MAPHVDETSGALYDALARRLRVSGRAPDVATHYTPAGVRCELDRLYLTVFHAIFTVAA